MIDESSSDVQRIATSGQRIELGALQRLFAECSPIHSGGWDRNVDAEKWRYDRWAGQSDDGRKWDENQPEGKVGVWDGCADFRPLATDQAARFLESVILTACRRMLRLDSTSDPAAGAYLRQFFAYLTKAKQVDKFWDSLRLGARYYTTFPLVAFHTDWRTEIAWKHRSITQAEVLQAELLDPQQYGGLTNLMLDPAREAEAVPRVQALYAQYAAADIPEWMELEAPPLSASDAKKFLADLRVKGTGKLLIPYLCENQPEVTPLKPWEEIIIPDTLTDIQSGPVFIRYWLTPAQLEQMRQDQEWTEEFYEAVRQRKGHVSYWRQVKRYDGAVDWQYDVNVLEQDIYEIAVCYRKTSDDDGVLAVMETWFHPQVGSDDEELVGKHGVLPHAHGKIPIVVARFETVDKTLLSGRSLPEMLQPFKAQYKRSVDGLLDRQDLTTRPPIVQVKQGGATYQPGQAHRNFRPFSLVSPNSMANAPKFMDVSGGNSSDAQEVLKLMQFMIDRSVGRAREDIAAVESSTILGDTVMTFLTAIAEVLQQMWALTCQYLPDSEWRKIVGDDAPALPRDPQQIAGEFRTLIEFNPMALDPEFVVKQIEALDRVDATDKAGAMDQYEKTIIKIEAINPSWVPRLVKSRQQATDDLRRKVKNDVAQMRAGVLPDLVENDPTAETQLQMLMEIIKQSPELQMAAQQDQGFQARLEQYVKNLQQSVVQRENVMTGRLGVQTPSALLQAPI